MSGQYPVTATVTPIYPSGQQTATTVKNIGTKTVYLGTSNSLSAVSGYALGPGSAIGWDANKPLYAVCATGDTSTLNALDNGGGLFDASAVASQILAQGLAASIAQQISITGAPPVDPLKQIADSNAPVAAGSGLNTPWINTGGYQSLIFRLYENTNGLSYTSPAPRRVTLIWSATSGGVEIAREALWLNDTNNTPIGGPTPLPGVIYQTSVKAQFVQIQWDFTARAAILDWTVTGSYKTVAAPLYEHISGYTLTHLSNDIYYGELDGGRDRLTGVYTGASVLQNNGAYTYWPSSRGGPASIQHTVDNSGLPAGGSFSGIVYALSEPAGVTPPQLFARRGNTGPFPYASMSTVYLPFAPLQLVFQYSNSTVGTWAPAATLLLSYGS